MDTDTVSLKWSHDSHHIMVEGCLSKLVNVVSEVFHGRVFGPLLFLQNTLEYFSILENKLIGYGDDSALMAVVPSSSVRVVLQSP